MTQYGGALFDDRCRCGDMLEMPGSISVNEFMYQTRSNKPRVVVARCHRCGDVESKFVRFVKAAI